MVDPNQVIYPRSRLQLVAVLFNGGANSYSVALVRWREEETEGEVWPYALGIRWNGGPDPKDKGGPLSSGRPIWYILPKDLVPWVLEGLLQRPETDRTALALAREKLLGKEGNPEARKGEGVG
ncbi:MULTISPECIES: hypothetical protein [Thermus]|uniref:Uncharacterized protein n=2 Tax=Thermus TaxID=270 RepID=A0A348XNL3_THESC|nr:MULTISPECIES: hypothetical protein [Thermus]RTH03988.1 hypothetical protein CSW47_07520 [Thermus scotoductus]BCP67554.1 hypothetical protein TthHB5018_c24880 [Thermus thermophilus]HAR68375.1 hypothetical protein [Thermus scotoductus]